MVTVWCHFFGVGPRPSQEQVLAALTRAGVSTRPISASGNLRAGIVFFDKPNLELYDLIAQTSRNGLDRVLAVAMSGASAVRGCTWELLGHGASDVFAWDHSGNPCREIAERFERWSAVDNVVSSNVVQSRLIGNSAIWINLLRQIVDVAKFTDSPVLIMGESGTGKELVARLIHDLDPREQKRNLVLLDCTTVVPELAGSEFFGHERGAFTGAFCSRDGAFALAHRGTLFLDEVGELPLGLQAELMRVVQERTYKRIGSNTWQHTDFRLVCATNRDLLDDQSRGKFRRDFYYRIASWQCKLPPLRERSEDILVLARHFLRNLHNGEDWEMDDDVKEYLVLREYTGNIRDLKQLVSRMYYNHVGPGPITVGDIPRAERPRPTLGGWHDATFEAAIRRAVELGAGLKQINHATTEVAIQIACETENGSLQRAARKLGVTDRALQLRRAARRLENNEIKYDKAG